MTVPCEEEKTQMSAGYENDHPTTNTHDPLVPWACEVANEGPAMLDMTVDFHGRCRACVIAAGSLAANRPDEARGWNPGRTVIVAHHQFYDEWRKTHGLPELRRAS